MTTSAEYDARRSTAEKLRPFQKGQLWLLLSRIVGGAAVLILGFGQPSSASQHLSSAETSPVETASSCYSPDEAISDEDKSLRDELGDRWLSTGVVQMSLRQISLLVDNDPSLHGYETSVSGQMIVVVHDRTSDPAAIEAKVRRAMTLGVADIESGSRSAFPTVVLYPACGQLKNTSTFDELENSVGSADWTDEPIFDEIGLAMERDLTRTQIVLTMEESNPTTDRIAMQLVETFGGDVRVVFDETHPMFNWEILALPGSDIEANKASEASQTKIQSPDSSEAEETQHPAPVPEPRSNESENKFEPVDETAAATGKGPKGGQSLTGWLVAALGVICTLGAIRAWKAVRAAS